ncbi:hypothetical protein MTR67_043997 [Solanum verrucosum]|uniref:Retrotransposon gag domain-containing protein n=1 Tax=Solanum verrucosum TaxID=315347 RepID=A0AAF0ZSI7_SOLVR|nr:hypothetical protein MTR67_043997 [Solanum verrucosum]
MWVPWIETSSKGWFFPLETWESKVPTLISLRQGNMSVKEYSLKFTQLSKYVSAMVTDSRARMSKFFPDIFEIVVKECRIAMLINEIDIFRLMIHAQQIEEENLKEKTRQTTRARTDSGDFSHSRLGGNGHS